MSANNNGKIRDSLDLYKWEKDTGGSLASNDEQLFRGFQKVPKVLCERYDIKPYLLKKMRQDLPPDLRKPIFVALHDICNYNKKCSVRLKRENLEHLKEVYLSKDRLLKKNFTCNISQKVYLSEKNLLNHQENKHVMCYKPQNKIRKKVSFSDEVIVHEVKEYHRCRKCPKIYDNYDALKSHMRDVHKKRKCYVCFYCSKDFVDRISFKVHIKLHCDACGLLLPDKKCYLEHRRNVCKIIKKYECKTCHISLFYFMDLKDHSYEHLGNFYICDICKDRFDDKCALTHHIKFLHSKKRPKTLYMTQILGNDTVYVCRFCNIHSVNRELIEKHVSTFPEYEKCAMTGYKDFYFCDQCFEKFSTETDMLQHKWSHFLKSSQQNEAQLPKPVDLVNTENLGDITQTIDSENVENLTETTTQNTQKPFKTVYNMKTDKLPPLLQPRILVEKLVFPKETISEKPLTAEENVNVNVTPVNFIDLTNLNEDIIKKPITVGKRTLLSKHQCQLCLKYLSTNFCLTRHMYSVHGISRDGYVPLNPKKGNFHCKACEEDFALPSLLKNHNCIRINLPEPPFQDARPEIQLDFGMFNQQLGFNDLDCNNDYMDTVDFDIPAPIVELTEYENVNLVINDNVTVNNDRPLNNVTVNNGRPLNNVTVNNGRPLNNVTVNNDRPLNNVTVNNDRQFNNATAINNNRQVNNVINNNIQLSTLLNNPMVHYDRRSNNVVNVNRQLAGQLNHTINDRRQPINSTGNHNRQFNNTAVNNDRHLYNTVNNHRQFTGRLNNEAFNHRPLNTFVYNDRQVNGQLNNVQSNLCNGKQTKSNVRYIVVQEVPIEF